MGKIFGISDLPVSTIHSALYPSEYKKTEEKIISKINLSQSDKFISKEKQNVPNAFIKMRNGIGKLLKHFSKVK